MRLARNSGAYCKARKSCLCGAAPGLSSLEVERFLGLRVVVFATLRVTVAASRRL
jgi:hypothetical protein